MPLSKEKLVEEANILSELEKVQKIIQHKHKMIKLGRENLEQTANDYFKPVLTPLRQIKKKVMQQPSSIKDETSTETFNLKTEKIEKSENLVVYNIFFSGLRVVSNFAILLVGKGGFSLTGHNGKSL